MTFRVGQRVVCVDAKAAPRSKLRTGQKWSDVYPTEGEVYTISWIGPYTWPRGEVGVGVHLVEFNRAHDVNGIQHPFRSTRFRPLISQADDIAMFTALVETMKPTERLDVLREMIDE
jgi:hypothetical protein